MSKQKKKGLMPALRFSEFRNAGTWECEFSDVLFDQTSNKTHNSDIPILAITQEQGAIPRNLIDYHVSVTDKSIESYKVVEVGDFIISLRSFQGGIEYSRYKGICSPAYVVLRLKPGYSANYFRHFLKTDRFIALLTKNLEGLRDGKMISYKQFSEILLPTPTRNEQQKIADCLTSIDDLITAQTQKLATLKTHKKGLMQQLFPEGETVPKLRFPEFRDKGEWAVKKLFQVCEINPSANALPESFVYIDLESVEAGRMLKKNYISRETAPSRAQRQLKHGDVIFQMVRPYQKNNYYFLPDDDLDYVASTGYAQLRANESSRFLFQYLHNDRFVDRVLSKCTGSNYPAINSSSLSEILVEVPQPREQQKIAEFLTAIDDLISNQTKKIEALKAHKKGLMQQLFPAMDEVDA